jgi:hypothetical protein
MASFTNAGDTLVLDIPDKGETIDVAISGTYNMTIDFEREVGGVGSGAFELITSYTTVNATVADTYTSKGFNERIRLILTTDTSGTATVTLTDNDDRTIHSFKDQVGNKLAEMLQSRLVLHGGLSHGSNGVVNTTEALTLTTKLHAGRIVTASNTTGFAITLPSASGTGDVYTVFYDTTVSSGNHTIVAPDSSTSFIGGVGIATDIAGVTVLANSGDDTITMNGSTTGGLLGTWLRFTDVATNIFMVEGFLCSTGTEADPFSAAV